MKNFEENKNYVTPYAFGVDDALLGKPLASPTRRLFSIGIDLLVVGSLTLMSTTAMAVSVLLVSIVGWYKARTKNAEEGTNSIAPKAFGFAAVLSGIVVAFSLSLSGLNLEANFSGSESSLDRSAEVEVNTDTEKEQPTDSSAAKEAGADLPLIERLLEVFADLGSGFGWAALYFSAFTAWFGGQTVGKLLFRMRVVKIDGNMMSFWESLGRYGGYSAGLATGLLGFLQVIWDPNRQAIHDKISETVVIDLSRPDRGH